MLCLRRELNRRLDEVILAVIGGDNRTHQEKSQLLMTARFSSVISRQIWAFMAILLLGSGPLAFESALLCTFRHFLSLSVAFRRFRHFESDRDVS